MSPCKLTTKTPIYNIPDTNSSARQKERVIPAGNIAFIISSQFLNAWVKLW
jgi:hypothetical protein